MSWFLLDTSGRAFFTIGKELFDRGYQPVNLGQWAYLISGGPAVLTYLQLRYPDCTVKEISLAEGMELIRTDHPKKIIKMS